MKGWQKQAFEHAQAEYPRESCGLVVALNGVESYRPCVNRQTGADRFEIGAEDYAAAEECGDVIAIVHSHPDAPCHPSEADCTACEASGLPWYIVGVPSGAWGHCAPCGYRAPLVGRPFAHGVLDCYAIIRDYYAWELGITLPDFKREDDWWARGGNLYRENFAAAGFHEVPLAEAKPSDMILMQVQAPVENHAAILLADGSILHHLHGRLSCRETYAGYWRHVTRAVLRHAQC